MGGRTPLGVIDGGTPHERVLVSAVQSADGELVVELLQQHYGPGIGWFNQRGLTLDSRQWRQLQAVLGHQAIAGELSDAAEAPRSVVPFPGPNDPMPARRVSGTR
jgi:hypothetical protein